MKRVAIIDAQNANSPLKEQLLTPLSGVPLLKRIVDRLSKSNCVSEIVVATTTQAIDDSIEAFCKAEKLNVYRGAKEDILANYYQIATNYQADTILCLEGQYPFVDAELLDMIVGVLEWVGHSFVSNDMIQMFPEGITAKALKYELLEWCHKNAQDTRDREEPMRYIWNNLDAFPNYDLHPIEDTKMNRPELRLTIEYQQDIQLAEFIYDNLETKNPDFTTRELIEFLDEHPDMQLINQNYYEYNI